ncbi:MAG: 50S ribosomal protein L30e [Candidatus Diapherotrites archaeon]|nr:50S ribosomal protein L30e [Candidatus Diapherotrites archaeon]
MTVDVNKEIRRAVDTGKVLFGAKQTEKSILNGKAKLIIIAKNTPPEIKDKLVSLSKAANKSYYEFEDNSLKLGSLCGKPFSVSAMAIIDEGKSKVMEITKKEGNKTEKVTMKK